MTIRLKCECGKMLKAPDRLAGKWAKCSGCGALMQIPPASSPAEVDPLPVAKLAPQPMAPTRVAPTRVAPTPFGPRGAAMGSPVVVPEGLRSPGLPPCWLSLSMDVARITASFDITPVLQAFVEAFVKKVGRIYDVQIGPAGPAAVPNASVQVLRIDEGNRALRYMLTFLAGKTCFEVQGTVTGPMGTQQSFQIGHKCSVGVFGGSGLGLLKVDARNLGSKVGKLLMRVP